MSPKNRWSRRPWIAALIFAILAGLSVLILGQQRGQMANPQSSMNVPILSHGPQEDLLPGLPEDWSFHHLVFTDSGSEEEAIAKGRHEEWQRIVSEPRYLFYQMKRARARAAAAAVQTPESFVLLPKISELLMAKPSPIRTKSKLTKDWNETLPYTTMPGGQYPAKFSFNSAASCSDYAIFPTGGAGSSTQANIIAYTNLYASDGCGSTIPSVYWAYYTPVGSGGGTVTLSPVIDWGGSQVAYVETLGSTSYLVLLHMANSGSGVTTLASGSYPCTAPCYTTLSLGTTDTNSAPFYDYAHDIMYVGDDAGQVHQFTTVFGGTPNPGWTSTTVGASRKLTGPVVDPNSGSIFFADSSGYLHSVSSSGGSLASSSQMTTSTLGIQDAPLVDAASSPSFVYVENPYGGTTGNPAYINIFSATSISSYGLTSLALTTTGTTSLKIYDGAFDQRHNTLINGNYYVCATDATSGSGHATLYQVAIGGTTAAPTLTLHAYNQVSTTNTTPTCSPVTEFYDGTHDWVFLSVTASGDANGCSGACLYNYSIPTSGTTTTGSATAGMNVAGGASGTIIDNNSSSSSGGSNIYFFPLAAGTPCSPATAGCAVQVSQSSP